jgi:imidazolonepropionase-like amidohydrolase
MKSRFPDACIGAAVMRNRRGLRSTLQAGLLATILFTRALLPGIALASDQIPAPAQSRPIAVVGAAIHPVSGPDVPDGTILFDRGKITAIGTGIPVPPGAQVIDGRGRHVYPGLISADTYLGLTEIGAIRASNDYTETGRINPNVRAETAVNPESELIPVTRSNGILLTVVAPRGPLVAGLSALMRLDGWTWEEMTLKAPAALNVFWPSMIIRRGPGVVPGEEEQRAARDRQLEELKGAFRDARAYRRAKLTSGQAGGARHDSDRRWEAMVPVLEGKVPVVVWANEIQQIQAAVAWAEAESLRVIIGGGHDSWRVAGLLREKHIPVIVGGTHRLPDRRFEAYDTPFTLPAKLAEAGVPFAIMSPDEAPHARNLPYEAATAAAYGLPKDAALKAITLSPAQIFGIADRVGSLEVGKDATLIVTTGDPLEIRTQVEEAFIEGRRIDLSNKQTELYRKYRVKYGMEPRGK